MLRMDQRSYETDSKDMVANSSNTWRKHEGSKRSRCEALKTKEDAYRKCWSQNRCITLNNGSGVRKPQNE